MNIGKVKIIICFIIFFILVFLSFKNIYYFFNDKEPEFEIMTENSLLRDLNIDVKVVLTESSKYNLPKKRIFSFVDRDVVHKSRTYLC